MPPTPPPDPSGDHVVVEPLKVAVTGAVIASVRHEDTPYGRLLMDGVERADARDQVRDTVTAILDGWRSRG